MNFCALHAKPGAGVELRKFVVQSRVPGLEEIGYAGGVQGARLSGSKNWVAFVRGRSFYLQIGLRHQSLSLQRDLLRRKQLSVQAGSSVSRRGSAMAAAPGICACMLACLPQMSAGLQAVDDARSVGSSSKGCSRHSASPGMCRPRGFGNAVEPYFFGKSVARFMR